MNQLINCDNNLYEVISSFKNDDRKDGDIKEFLSKKYSYDVLIDSLLFDNNGTSYFCSKVIDAEFVDVEK